MANKKSHNKGYSSSNNKNNNNNNNNTNNNNNNNNNNNTSSGYYDAQKPKNYTLQAQQNSSFGASSFGTTTSGSVFGTTSNRPAVTNTVGSSFTASNAFVPSNNTGFGSGTFGSSSFGNRGGFGSGATTTIQGSGGFGSSSFASLSKPATSTTGGGGFGQSSFASIVPNNNNNSTHQMTAQSAFTAGGGGGGVFNPSSGGGFGSFSSGTQFGKSSFSSVAGSGGFGQGNLNTSLFAHQTNSSFPSTSSSSINQPSSLNSTTFTKTTNNAPSKSNVIGGGGFSNPVIVTNSGSKFDPTIKSDKYANAFTRTTPQPQKPSAALEAKETMTVVKDKTLIEQLSEKFNDLFSISNENLVNEKLINNYFGQLTNDDKHAFSSSTFHIGKIPEVPPSEEFCK